MTEEDHGRQWAAAMWPKRVTQLFRTLSVLTMLRAGIPGIHGLQQSLSHAARGLQEGIEAACPIPDEIALEIRPSLIPNAGLGVFLSPSSPTPIPIGCPLTAYGGDLMLTKDMEDFSYALLAARQLGVVLVGREWNGSLPAFVNGSTDVGYLMNDAAAIALSDDMLNLSKMEEGEGIAEVSRELREGGELSMARMQRLVEAYHQQVDRRLNVGFDDEMIEAAQGADFGACHRREEEEAEDGGSLAGGVEAGSVACVREAMAKNRAAWMMKTSREIHPGNEVYYSYGHAYWLKRSLDPDQLQSSLHRLWVERYLAENGDVDNEPEGVLYLDAYGRLVDSLTGKQAREERCQHMMSVVLRWEAQPEEMRREVMERVGIRAGMPYRQALEKLYEYTVDNSL